MGLHSPRRAASESAGGYVVRLGEAAVPLHRVRQLADPRVVHRRLRLAGRNYRPIWLMTSLATIGAVAGGLQKEQPETSLQELGRSILSPHGRRTILAGRTGRR